MANLRTVEKTTMIDRTEDPRAPVPGAAKVFFKIDGMWVHKGWLMPEVTEGGYKPEEMVGWVDCEKVDDSTWHLSEDVS